MPYVADLHIHSRFSRACSSGINIPNLAKWAKLKGVDLLGTGDFLHPLWQNELKSILKDTSNGLFEYDGVKFLLTTEISCIYSDKGRVRRIHLIVFMPTWETVIKLSEELKKRRVNIASDGRPITGLSARELTEIILTAEPKSLVIPAHCLKPDTFIHTKEGVKQIQNIKKGDYVYTHNNRACKVEHVFQRSYKGVMYNIIPWYFSLGLATTFEHPFYALVPSYCSSTGDKCLPSSAHKKKCRNKFFENYKPSWIPASQLKVGDILVFPRFINTTPIDHFSLNSSQRYKTDGEHTYTGGTRGHVFNSNIVIDENFCRLIGYYLAEGCTSNKGEVRFAFKNTEKKYIEDVIFLMNKVFGINHHRLYERNEGTEVIFASKLLVDYFTSNFYTNPSFRATTKIIPDWMLHLPLNIQIELLRGWWRGDEGYTSSKQLMNGIKIICLRLGLIPSISEDTPEKYHRRGKHLIDGRFIKMQSSSYVLNNLAFFEDKYGLLKDPSFKKFKRKLDRRHGWIDAKYIYIPIRKIEKTIYNGEVFNLEVEKDNSYLAEFAAVHNCWTPWFSLFGSESGYDRLEDCFGDLSSKIIAIETGLSSEPAMNWRVKELDNRSIISNSDAHSMPNLGREATIFKGKPSFEGLFNDLKTQNILGTIEFFPEEGKYHYSGHRNCGIVYSPLDLKKNGQICPKCHKKLTIGVMERVEELAGRSEKDLKIIKNDGIITTESLDFKIPRPGFRMLVGLEKIIAESLGVTLASKKVRSEYEKLVMNLGSELMILTKTPLEDIKKYSNEKITEGIDRVRKGKLSIQPGYDNTYGIISIWGDEKKQDENSQLDLF